MRKVVVLVALAAMAITPNLSRAADGFRLQPEGCQAFNPAQSKCVYTVTHPGASPVSGIAGVGKWVVKIKVGRKITTVRSPASGEPTEVEMRLRKGARVTAIALTPGSGLTVGHVD
jgi:hypothetical protein